jgi:DNA-binding NarL/FixJ family response regulator
MEELRETLNLIRNFAHILQEHQGVLEKEEVAQAAAAIEEQSELGLRTLDQADGATALGGGELPYGLSPREHEVLVRVASGEADKQIAAALGISTYTASKHVGAILMKMGAVSRTEAGVRALREGLIRR